MGREHQSVGESFNARAPIRERTSIERWLIVESIVSADPSSVHHVRAALISRQTCHPQGLRWLIEQLKLEGQRADYATSVLIEFVENGQI